MNSLHYYVKYSYGNRRLDIVKLLINGSCSPEDKDNKGQTAIDLATPYPDIHTYLRHSVYHHRQWRRVAFAVVWVRATKNHIFCYSFLPLVPFIMQLVDGKNPYKKRMYK